uniref:Ribonuclease Z n=1 Tax=Lympha mucosa TaxID=2045360 RepID=A0A6B9VP51_9FLOR|nr:Ribonuclease Z [Lympha mucosa]
MIQKSISFLIKRSSIGIVWLFNCPEGCQHILIQKKIKLNQINNIFITSLEIKNIAGITGLLSSLSLNSRIHTLNIYGPQGLFQYLQLSRKYSQTTFKYKLNIYIVQNGFIKINHLYNTYIYPVHNSNNKLQCLILEEEKTGRFKPQKANIFQIKTGPLYGKLKSKYKLIGPDGCIIRGQYFTNQYDLGFKIIYLFHNYCHRNSIESTWINKIIKQNNNKIISISLLC